jgi:hypothetical protein
MVEVLRSIWGEVLGGCTSVAKVSEMPRGSARARRVVWQEARGGRVATWIKMMSIDGHFPSASHSNCLLYAEKSWSPPPSMVATLRRFVASQRAAMTVAYPVT